MEKNNRPHHRAAISIGWDDVPWLDQKTKDEILASTPPHLRETVSRGVPSIGFGAVYPVPLEQVLVKPEEMIQIPHWWRRLYGMDVGHKVTAAVFIAHDPDNDIIYVVGEHYGEQQPKEVNGMAIKRVAGDWMPGVIDPGANQTAQTDGQNLMQEYRRMGLKLYNAENSMTSGLQEVWSRLAGGKLKFWPNTPKLQNEYILYHYDQNVANPKPVKQHDHALDALRYAVMGLKYAKPYQAVQIQRAANRGPTGKRYNV